MSRRIALLRAINLPSHNKVSMSDLRGLLTRLGFDNVRSLLQTGNLVFDSDRSAAELERLLEAEAAKRLRLQTGFFVRTAAECKRIVERNPFPNEARRDPGHLVVIFLKRAPGTADVESLRAAIRGPEIIEARGKELYIVYSAGIGRSRLTNALIEKKLGTPGTGRNWNTVLKLCSVT